MKHAYRRVALSWAQHVPDFEKREPRDVLLFIVVAYTGSRSKLTVPPWHRQDEEDYTAADEPVRDEKMHRNRFREKETFTRRQRPVCESSNLAPAFERPTGVCARERPSESRPTDPKIGAS